MGPDPGCKGMEYLKTSKHLQKLYRKKNDCIKDYIHKMTRYITNYCVKNDIHTVVIGDIKGFVKRETWGGKPTRSFTVCHMPVSICS